jgi:hypothetical protein
MKLIPGNGISTDGKTLELTARQGLRRPPVQQEFAGGTAAEQAAAALGGSYFKVTATGLLTVAVGPMLAHICIPTAGIGGTTVAYAKSGQTLGGLTPGTSYWLYVVADQQPNYPGYSDYFFPVFSGPVEIPDEFNVYSFRANIAAEYAKIEPSFLDNIGPPLAEEPLLVIPYTSPRTSSAAYAYYLIAELDVDAGGNVTVRQRHLGAVHLIGVPMLWEPQHILTATELD